MSTRSLNGLSSITINSFTAGNAIKFTSGSTSQNQTIDLSISKQSANTTINSTDLFLLEDSSGNIRKITGANMKSELEQSTVVEPLLLTGNAISIKGLNGFTANKILKVNSAGDSIEYADDVDTNFWSYSTPSLHPINTTDNILIGTNTNTNSRKLLVVGDSEIQGDLNINLNGKIISSNNTNDYLQFADRTFINNYFSNVFTYGLSFGASADITLSTGRAISRANDTDDRITFNSGNFTYK